MKVTLINGTGKELSVHVSTGHSASETFDTINSALQHAGVEKYTLQIWEGVEKLRDFSFPQGNWVRVGSKVRTRHGVAHVVGIEDTTHSRSEDPKEGGVSVKKFDLDAKFRGKQKTGLLDTDDNHFSYIGWGDPITVLEY